MNKKLWYSIIRALAGVLTALGVAEFTEADIEAVVASAVSVFAAVDVILAGIAARRKPKEDVKVS